MSEHAVLTALVVGVVLSIGALMSQSSGGLAGVIAAKINGELVQTHGDFSAKFIKVK